jgi:hypothetical protein
VSSTTRRKAADLDIREHTMWIPDDVGLTSVEDVVSYLSSLRTRPAAGRGVE